MAAKDVGASNRTQPGSGYWHQLTDEELLRIRFTTDDPERLSHLVLDVPTSDGKEPRVEMFYDFRGTKRDLIRCAHCRYPNHKAGFVIRYDDSRFLCGIDCGAKIYGADFQRLHKDFTYARDRAGYLRRMSNLRRALPAFKDYLLRLRAEPAFDLYAQTRQQLIRDMPRLRGALQIAIDKQGGALIIEDRARDFDAEQRDEERYERELADWNSETVTERKKLRRQGHQPEKPKKPLWRTVPKRIGTVPLMTLFSVETSPKQYITAIAAQFDNIGDPPVNHMSKAARDQLFAYRGKRDGEMGLTASRVSLTVGGDTSNAGMANMLKQVGILLERIEQQIDRLAEIPTFFHPMVLGPVAEWATARKLAGAYMTGHNRIIFTDDEEGNSRVVSLPADYRVPSKVGVQTFRDAINTEG
jgi:hypothetical protein